MDQLCNDTLFLINSVDFFFFASELSQTLGTKENGSAIKLAFCF